MCVCVYNVLKYYLQRRIQEKVIYDDLNASCDININNGAPLNLTHVNGYLCGPVSKNGNTELTSEELVVTLNHLKKEASGWVSGNTLPRQASIVNSAATVLALVELTPGGSLMKGFREESLGRKYIFLILNDKLV